MQTKPPSPLRLKPQRVFSNGFTLIELLVALSVMALLALLSWRSIDGMSRAQTGLSARSDEALTLQASLTQLKFDLDAITQTPRVSSLDWDGRVLRLTRLSAVAGEGLQVVAWTRRFDGGGQWLRWQSPATREHSEWRQSWSQAAEWAENATPESKKRETLTVQLSDWQIFYYRNNAWSNPLSSDGVTPTQAPKSTATPVAPAASAPVAATPAASTPAASTPAVATAPVSTPVVSTPAVSTPQVSIPDGIRVVLSLPPGQGLTGKLTLDWVRPNLGGDQQ